MYAGMIGMVGIPAIQAMASYGAGGSIVSGLSSAITGLGTTVIGGAAVFSVLPVALAVGLGGAALMVISKNVKRTEERAEQKRRDDRNYRTVTEPRERFDDKQVTNHKAATSNSSATAFVSAKTRTAQEAAGMLRIDGLKREAVRMDQSDNGLAKPGNVIAMKGAA
jgi:hypothetical protein